MTVRPLLFAANWKMHIDPSEAEAFASTFLRSTTAAPGREIWFFPPAVSLLATASAFAGRPDVRVGAQDIHWEPKGAFTGATSVPLAKASGAEAALVGHSERRHVFGETDTDTGRKVAALLEHGLIPVLCVGERLEERDAGGTDRVVQRQLNAGLTAVDPESLSRLVIAYEPVWAIGTGKTATPEDAAAVHRVIRDDLERRGAEPAAIPILYGGSVKVANVRVLLEQPELDGVLVGGASLDPAGWAELVKRGSEGEGGQRTVR